MLKTFLTDYDHHGPLPGVDRFLYDARILENWIPWISLIPSLECDLDFTESKNCILHFGVPVSYGSRIELKLESIALGLNSNETQIGRHGTPIALELEGHGLGLNSNVTQVSSSLGSLCRSNFIFRCKRVNGPTKQPKKF